MNVKAQSDDRRQNGVSVSGLMAAGYDQILSDGALEFVAALGRRFGPRVTELLDDRRRRQNEIDQGAMPDFLKSTKEIRNADWTVARIPNDLLDRRVEITGPTDRKMIINALNSGAKAFMADCEDSLSPTWTNIVEGQINLRDAVAGTISFTNDAGKTYRLADRTATLIVRPRGWHFLEAHIAVDGKAIPGGLVDFGLYLYHNAKTLIKNGSGPYFYLPKLESHLEARLWNDVIAFSISELDLPAGCVKVTILIETILAVFEMDEILYELRDYIVGLNCGRWDYIFSFIKKFRHNSDFLLPDRQAVGMDCHFLRSYSQLLIKTCHRRGAFAMGGMAAQIPIKGDEQANRAAMEKVTHDKEREAGDGHDGTWVAHPGLIPLAADIFDRHMSGQNQLDVLRDDVSVSADDLLRVPDGDITEAGLRNNISVAIQYLAAWLSGNGCVPINHLMEDAATAEISRAQLWQWARHSAGKLADGRDVDLTLVATVCDEELAAIRSSVGESLFVTGRYAEAADLLMQITKDDDFVDFLTLVAYPLLDERAPLDARKE